MKKQSKKTIFLFLMLFTIFSLVGCENINDEVTIEKSNSKINIETLGEFERDPEFEKLMRECKIPENSQTNELEKEIIAYSNDKVSLLNVSNILYTVFVFENDTYQRTELYFDLETPEIASEFYNQLQNPDVFNKLESPEDIENLKSAKRIGSYIIFECKDDSEEYRDITKADMDLSLEYMVKMYEQE